MRQLTLVEVAEAYRLRCEERKLWREVAAHFGLSVEGLRRQIDPTYRAERNAYQKRWMRAEKRARRAIVRTAAPLSAIRRM